MGCGASAGEGRHAQEPSKEHRPVEQTLLTSSGQAQLVTGHAEKPNKEQPPVEEGKRKKEEEAKKSEEEEKKRKEEDVKKKQEEEKKKKDEEAKKKKDEEATKKDDEIWQKFGSVQVEFMGISGNKSVSSVSAKVDTTIGVLRTHVLTEVKGGDVVLSSGSTILGRDEQKLSECTVPSETGTIDLTYVIRGDPTDAEVTANPGRYKLCLSGHVRNECNGLYAYDGKENGKDKWSKPGSKVFWTFWGGRGHTWDIYWGGVSPENKSDTAIPPRSGWDGQGQAANTIKISYVYA